MEEITLYEILGVSQNATLKEIKIAYRKRAMEYHPDNPDKNKESCHQMMCKINEAYSFLRNPVLRALYDEKLYEEGKCEVAKEEDSTSRQETTSDESQPKTYRKVYKPNSKYYDYYNTMDFDESLQEEFIKWIEDFSYGYIRIVFDYYRKLNKDNDGILEKIYSSFDSIIDYEKSLSKKEVKFNSL